MSSNSRFVVGVHLLSALALASHYRRQKCVTSAFLAASVNTNPVVVRRILSRFREVGIVDSQAGARGGSRLLRDPLQLTLLDIYEAVEEEGLFHLHHGEPNPACPIGRNIQDALSDSLDEAESAMKESLARTTLAQIIEKLTPAVEEYLSRQSQPA